MPPVLVEMASPRNHLGIPHSVTGSATAFEAVCLGSNPGEGANFNRSQHESIKEKWNSAAFATAGHP